MEITKKNSHSLFQVGCEFCVNFLDFALDLHILLLPVPLENGVSLKRLYSKCKCIIVIDKPSAMIFAFYNEKMISGEVKTRLPEQPKSSTSWDLFKLTPIICSLLYSTCYSDKVYCNNSCNVWRGCFFYCTSMHMNYSARRFSRAPQTKFTGRRNCTVA